MAKRLVQIRGFKELQRRVKRLGDDRDKRGPVVDILRKSAESTIQVAQGLSPKVTGRGSRSIDFKEMKRAVVPMGVVGPRSVDVINDGYHLRLFVIPGHNIYRVGFKRNRQGNRAYNTTGAKSRVPANYFMNRAQEITQNRVSASAVPSMERFIQKKINELGLN